MKVTVLTVWNSDTGNSQSSLHTTPFAARCALGEWVGSMWDQEKLGRSVDDDSFHDDDDRIVYFFEKLSDNYQFDVEDKHVNGSEEGVEPPLGPDEVLLDPVEVRAVVHALRTAPYKSVGKEIGTNSYHAADIVHKIIGKLTD